MKICLFDIETAPNLGFIWGKYEQDVIAYDHEWYMLCFAYKWLGGKTQVRALPDFKGYKPGSQDDKALVKELWKLFDEADIVVAQNGDAFDIKKTNARFLFHGLKPPSPYKTIDTLKLAKRHFAFNSNKLDDIGKTLGLGEKIKTDFSLWMGCMNGDKKSWERMKNYNKQDVDLLEKIYLKFRAWGKINTTELPGVCPKCDGINLQWRGYYTNLSTKYKRFQCKDCGGWGRATMNLQKTKPLVSV